MQISPRIFRHKAKIPTPSFSLQAGFHGTFTPWPLRSGRLSRSYSKVRWPVGRGHSSYLLLRGSVDAGSTYLCAGPYGRGQTPHLPMRWSLRTQANTNSHSHSATLASLSLSFSMAHGSLALALCALAGARHGASAPTRPRGALAPHSGDVPPSRVSATPWPGAAPPSQPPLAPPRCRRTRPGASSAARRTRTGLLAHASPASTRGRVGGTCTAYRVARRTSAHEAGSF